MSSLVGAESSHRDEDEEDEEDEANAGQTAGNDNAFVTEQVAFNKSECLWESESISESDLAGSSTERVAPARRKVRAFMFLHSDRPYHVLASDLGGCRSTVFIARIIKSQRCSEGSGCTS